MVSRSIRNKDSNDIGAGEDARVIFIDIKYSFRRFSSPNLLIDFASWTSGRIHKSNWKFHSAMFYDVHEPKSEARERRARVVEIIDYVKHAKL